MIERIHLEILKALKSRGSLTEAADKLCLTQSALTHSIKKLEKQLGSALWMKEGRKLHLTQAGEYLYQSALRILPQLEEIESLLKLYADGKKGKLRIGVECHPCFQWLVGRVNQFLANWPDVDLDVTRSFQFDGLDALIHREVDLIVTPDLIVKEGISNSSIKSFELKLMVCKDHSFQNGTYINPEDLKDQRIYTYPVPRNRLDIFTSFLDPAGISPAGHETVETAEIMVQLTQAGRGVSAFPDWLIDEYKKKYKLDSLSLGKRGIQKNLYLLWREEDTDIPYLKDFVTRQME